MQVDQATRKRLRFRVRGLKAGGYLGALQEALRARADTLLLVPEPNNPVHKQAIAVWLCAGEREWKVGYVPREIADEVGGDPWKIRVTGWWPVYYNRLPAGLEIWAVVELRQLQLELV